MNINELEVLVVDKIGQGRSTDDIVTMLVMNDDYSSKALARVDVGEIVERLDIKPKKKVPMSVQLKEWYLAQGLEALDLSKKDIEKQVLLLGMSGGSVKYYTDMYHASSQIAKQLIELK